MQIVLGSQSNVNQDRRSFKAVDRPLVRTNSQNRQNRLLQRAAEREREMQIRERENEFIKKLQEKMAKVELSDKDEDIKRLTISSLEDQVRQILDARAEREQMAIEREAQRNKLDKEERRREQEERARAKAAKNQDPEEAAERAKIRDLTLMSARTDKINSLSQTRARLVSEAEQLGQDIENSRNLSKTAARDVRHRNTQYGTIGPEHVISWQTNGGDFRQNHLSNLNSGISGLDAAINIQIAALYKDSQEMQETQLELAKEGESSDYAEENIDLRL